MSFEWIVPPERAFAELYDDYANRIHAGIDAIMTRRAPEIEAWMKANAVWTDRTGHARQLLYTDVEAALTEIAMLISQGVEYGQWLELAHQGKYAIVGPTLDYWAKIIWNDVLEMLSG